MTNRKKAQADKTKTQCIRAAVEVFARKGFHRARLDDIAVAAGVTHGALYWHYRSKEEFLIAVLEALTAHWTRDQLANFPLQGRADLVLRRFFHRSAQSNERAPWVNRLSRTVSLDAENIHPRVREIVRDVEATRLWFYSKLVRHGQDTGVFDPGLSPEEVASVLAAAEAGATTSWYADPERVDLQRLSESIVRSLLSGILSRGFAGPSDPEKERTAIQQIDEEIRAFYESRVPSYIFGVAEPIRRTPN